MSGEVVTTGTGEVERTADRAHLNLTFTARGRDRAAAVTELTGRVRSAEAVLERAGVEVRSRNLSVHDVWSGRRRTGAQADQHYLVRVTDLAALDDVIGELLVLDPVNLGGPRWDLTDQVTAAREAQRLAVADAKDRAEGYADALGSTLGPLVRIADGGVSSNNLALNAPMFARAGAGGPPQVADLSLEPQPVTVRATCTATWSLTDQS